MCINLLNQYSAKEKKTILVTYRFLIPLKTTLPKSQTNVAVFLKEIGKCMKNKSILKDDIR